MVQPAIHLSYMVQPVAPGLQDCLAHNCTKQCKIKSSAREDDAIQRDGKHEMSEAAAGVSQHRFTANFFLIRERVHSKVTKYSILC